MKFKEILTFNFNGKLFLLLFTGFIIATIIGTMAYCIPGFIIGKSLGYDAKIHYGYFSNGLGCKKLHANWDYLDSMKKKYPEEIKANADFPEKMKYNEELSIRNKRIEDGFYMHLGAIGLPILIGTFGLILLFVNRRKYADSSSLNFKKWVLIFLSLFWLRSAFFFWGITFLLLFSLNKYYFYDNYISNYLHLGKNVFPIAAGILGTLVLIIVVFKFIPKQERFTFLLSGLTGGLTGFYLWFFVLGKYFLP